MFQPEPLQLQIEQCAAYCESFGTACGSFSLTTSGSLQNCTVYVASGICVDII